MFRVYDGLTGSPLSFKYPTRDQAEHVEAQIKRTGRKTITLPCTTKDN